MGESSLDDWNLTNIDQNNEEICKQFKQLFKQWIDEYEPKETPSSQAPKLTEEELALIKSIQEKGYKISLE